MKQIRRHQGNTPNLFIYNMLSIFLWFDFIRLLSPARLPFRHFGSSNRMALYDKPTARARRSFFTTYDDATPSFS